jgi:hypothetical protein
MNNRELVVRIIQPTEQPQPPKVDYGPVPQEKKPKSLMQVLMNGLGLAAIGALGIYFAVSFFNLGFSFNDVLILIGIPVVLGVIASYAIF